MILAGLTVLGVLASIFLIFSDSVQLLRVGLVVALWAAVLASIAMTKYRRESALDRVKARDLQTVYELQLEREISARREFEMGVEARVRQEVGADAQELAALRRELEHLRSNLEALFKGFDADLPPERHAVRADSSRVGELGRGSFQASDSGLLVPGAATPPPAFGPGRADPPRFASPSDDPVTAETSVVVLESLSEQSGNGDSRKAAAASLDADEGSHHEALPEPAPGSRRHRRAAAADGDDAGSGGHSTGVSVAELLANLNAENSSAQPAGRSRRRAN
ncbi:hypothetical protein FOS14_17510 [Skermania sp. ID1734]|nr:hypothetical protein FOS14_17510 [Skermania sp. ID1734]